MQMKRNLFIPGLMAAATVMGLGLANSPMVMGGGALRPKGPKIPYGEFLDLRERGRKHKLSRKQRVQMAVRARRRREHGSNLMANVRYKVWRRDHSARAFNDVVNKMTNHERHQWHKAQYPGLRNKDIYALAPFAMAALRRLTGLHGSQATPKNMIGAL